jgi:gas vesicle protein
MKDSQTGSFFAGVVIGGLIGAAIGLILAPETGEEMREHVGGFVDARRTAFGDAVNEGKMAAEQARLGMRSDAEITPSAEGYAG